MASFSGFKKKSREQCLTLFRIITFLLASFELCGRNFDPLDKSAAMLLAGESVHYTISSCRSSTTLPTIPLNSYFRSFKQI
jgi:hypothetical protein